MSQVRAAISGIATYVPDYVLDNKELESMVDTNDEWIKSRTGISERRILKGDGRGVTYMAKRAIDKLLQKTNTAPEEIELVIFCTVTPDRIFPASANIVSRKCGLSNAWGFDLEAACSGFLFGLQTGNAMIKSGLYKKVIVVGCDKMSSIVDYEDRTTCILFGDAGGAVLLEPTEEEVGIMDARLYSNGIGEDYLHMKAGGSVKPPSIESVQNKEHVVFQEGKTVFKFAVTNMADACVEIMSRNNLEAEDISYLLAHQANKRIIDATANRMGLDHEKVLMNIQRYGNTTCATIPLLMSDFEDKFNKGDNLILSAFGGGFTWGAIHLKWAI